MARVPPGFLERTAGEAESCRWGKARRDLHSAAFLPHPGRPPQTRSTLRRSLGESAWRRRGSAGRRFLDVVRLAGRILLPDGLGAERLPPGAGPLGRGIGRDLLDQNGDLGSVSLRSEVLPAGELNEAQDFGLGELLRSGIVPLHPRQILARAVVPDSLHWFSGDQRGAGMDTRPLLDSGDEVFLDRVGEDIGQPLDLRGFFVADDDRLIAPGPDLIPPSRQAADLTGDLGIEDIHTGSELLGVVDPKQGVVMVRDACDSHDADSMAPAGSGESPDDDAVEQRPWGEQEAPLEGSSGDLDESAAFGDEAEEPWHGSP